MVFAIGGGDYSWGMEDFPPLTGTPRLTQVAEIARQRIAADAARFAIADLQCTHSGEWPELMAKHDAIARFFEITDAAWWVARRERSIDDLLREQRGEIVDRRKIY